MRRLILLATFICFLPNSSLLAQDRLEVAALCSYYGDSTKTDDLYGFASDQKTEQAVDRMVRTARQSRNFQIKAANVANVSAAMQNQERWLLYNTYFIQLVLEESDSSWPAKAILAHAVGHHLLGHDLSSEGNRPVIELEADRFSGYVLYHVGSSLPQALSALKAHKGISPSSTHPPASTRLAAVEEGWLSAKEAARKGPQYGYEYAFGTSPQPVLSDETPTFPWPPPKASASVVVPRELFLNAGTLGEIAARLEEAFGSAGYVERSYYAVPQGFAIVSRIEQIYENGSPKEPPDRWSIKVRPLSRFSLMQYFKAIFTATAGHFRIVVFIVSPHAFTQENFEVEVEEARAWLVQGLDALPASIGAMPCSENYKCTALIYEFELSTARRGIIFKDPSPLTGRTHLEKARLWEAIDQ